MFSQRRHTGQACAGDAGASPQEVADPESERSLTRPWVLAITGASGAPYAVRLLDVLVAHQIPVQLIVSQHGWRLLHV
ncbi:MAG: hypothetical protein IH966_02685, partial [Gemmatimonadetes bacterium]|nr:hypothetical protein [Gemmatimonadota bacterium]